MSFFGKILGWDAEYPSLSFFKEWGFGYEFRILFILEDSAFFEIFFTDIL